MGGHLPHGLSPGGFQYQVAQKLMGRLPRRHTDEKWEYTLASAAREESGFEVMEEYIGEGRTRSSSS